MNNLWCQTLSKLLTTLQGLDQQSDHHVFDLWNTMYFHGLGELSTSLNQRLGHETLTVVPLPVCDQKGMLRELGTPCENGGYECWMGGVLLFDGRNLTLWTVREVEPGTELRGVKKG